ncbi:MAG: DUF424 family protein [Candidatus Methanoperedens sp.]
MFMKKYDTDGKVIVAVCDSDIIGKKFKEGNLVLKLEESFYKGCEASENEIKDALACASIANIAGKRSIACAVGNGFIDQDTVIYVDGIPHAQMVQI